MSKLVRLFILAALLATSANCHHEPPSNKDIPQHFTITMEVKLDRSNKDAVTGQLIGHMIFDDEMRHEANKLLQSGVITDEKQLKALNIITTGRLDTGLPKFTITGESQTVVTDDTGSFTLHNSPQLSTISMLVRDKERGKETAPTTLSLPSDGSAVTIPIPLQFDHRHDSHDSSLTCLHSPDPTHKDATMCIGDLRCRKCNGWWDWDGGRAGSDCFIALMVERFEPCWGELMNDDKVFGGRFCDGTKNCSSVIGHGWADDHTHGSSNWKC